jgi:isopenicillin-N epimerase
MKTSRRSFISTSGLALAGGYSTSALSRTAQCSFSELPKGFIYLNSGTEGSMPDCVLSTFQNGLAQWAANPTTSYELDPVLGKRQELNREKVAGFLGVGKNNICLTDNTTMGCSMTLMGLNFAPGDKVVTTNHEHNAIRSPLQVLQARQGLKVETQSFPPTDKLNGMGSIELIDAIFPNTPALQGAKALCVSHVYPTTGVRLPLRLLREKADELGIRYLVVDGAQAMGMVDLGKDGDNIDNCDFYACPGHKWLNGPPSTGVLYIKNADIRPPEFYPTISQRMGKYVDCSDDSGECFPMVKALQVRGCSNTPGFAAMVGAMKYVGDAGGAVQVEKHILALSQEVKRFILSRAPDSIVSPHADPALQSGLTTFYPFLWDKPQSIFQDKKSADWVVTKLLKKNIQVRSIGVPGPVSSGGKSETRYVIRVSTGFFNTAAEVELFKTALQEVLTRIS